MLTTKSLKFLSRIGLLLIIGYWLMSCGKLSEQASAPATEQTQTMASEEPIAYSMQEDPASIIVGEAAPNDAAAMASATPMDSSPEPEFGNILFNPPTHMIRDKTERIEVRISRDAMDASGLIGTGDVIKDTVRVSDRMSVALYGDKFNVIPITDEQQLLEASGYTEWSFDVTPLQAAKDQRLTLKVSIHFDSGLKNKLVYSQPITIDVDSKSAMLKGLTENWQLLVLLLFAAIVAFFVIRALRGGKKSYKRSGDEAVFISYRRDDSSGYTLAIYEQLKRALGDNAVFMDVDDIPHGEDFVVHLDKVLTKANTVLVMIGEQWLNAANANGRRLDDPNDFVRMEIAKALQRNIRVIPVLLKNAQMPTAAALPETLQTLSRKNGIRIYDDQFEASIQRLLDAIATQ